MPRGELLRRQLASACLVLCLVLAGLIPAADVTWAASDGTDEPRDFHLFNADAEGFDWVNSYLLSYLSEYVYLEALDVEEAEFEAAFRAQIDGLGLTFVDYVTKPWSLEGIIEDTQLVVVETEDAIIFVFRGSEQLADWVTDLTFLTTGGVHLGFSTAVASVLPEIRAHIDASAGKKVWLTGHSLGGALATVTALRLGFAQEADLRDVQGITTYGGPRALAKTSQNDAVGPYETIYPAERTQRWANNEDVVPHIPPLFVLPDILYSHVGQLNNIIPDGVGGCLVDDNAENELPVSLNLVNGFRDHAGYYYLTRIYTNMPNDLRLLMPEPPYPDVVLDCDRPLDVTPPVITPTVEGTIGDNGWYVSDVTVSFTVQDPNSDIESETGCGTTVIDTDTVGTTVTCTATSKGGTSTQRVEIKRDATAPDIDLGGPYVGFEGDAIVLDGSASLDATSGIVHAEWSSAQPGLLGATADPATFVPADNGDYEFTLTLTDAAGNRSTATTTVVARNAPPTVDAGPGRTADEGELVELAVSFNDPGSLDTHTATIDWGDGTTQVVGLVTEAPFGPPGSLDGLDGQVAGEHVYADNGTYTVEICVTDKDADTGCDQLVLTVANVAPTVEFATIGDGPLFFLPFVEIPVEARFNDPGTLDTHTARFFWGDNSFSQGRVIAEPFGPPGSVKGLDGTVSGSHTYAAPATYQARLEVTDKDDGVGGVNAEIQVLSPIEALDRVIDDLANITAGTSDEDAVSALLAARGHLAGANDPSRSGALQRLEDGDRSAAVRKLGEALEKLELAAAADPSLELGLVQLVLTQIAESVAAGIYGEARDALDPPSRGQLRQLTSIATALEAGRTARAAGQWSDAVASFHEVTRRSSDLLL